MQFDCTGKESYNPAVKLILVYHEFDTHFMSCVLTLHICMIDSLDASNIVYMYDFIMRAIITNYIIHECFKTCSGSAHPQSVQVYLD